MKNKKPTLQEVTTEMYSQASYNIRAAASDVYYGTKFIGQNVMKGYTKTLSIPFLLPTSMRRFADWSDKVELRGFGVYEIDSDPDRAKRESYLFTVGAVSGIATFFYPKEIDDFITSQIPANLFWYSFAASNALDVVYEWYRNTKKSMENDGISGENSSKPSDISDLIQK